MPVDPNFRFGTLAVHAGQEPEPTTGAIMTPIFQTSTYVQPAVAEPLLGYDYARVSNPTREALERNVAVLEGGRHGIAFASGARETITATEARRSRTNTCTALPTPTPPSRSAASPTSPR